MTCRFQTSPNFLSIGTLIFTLLICTGYVSGQDVDEDGFDVSVDCDDNDPCVNFNAPEICDLIDNDCNGLIDDNNTSDLDDDGFTECDGDCNDLDASVFPGAAEIPDNGIDEDCNCTDLITAGLHPLDEGMKEVKAYFDLFGKPCSYEANKVIFIQYSDGSYERTYRVHE
ncbi:MAG: putative metal-binding motif-containing protein [Bacteroidota bacterium]|jgi:hypothetical protein